MKKTRMVVAVAAILATAVAFAATRWFMGRHHRHAVPLTHDVTWLTRELELTGSQASEVERSEREFRGQMEEFCAAHCAARFALGEELAKANPDLKKARALVEKMNAVQSDEERATLEHITKVRALLTPEQAQRYGSVLHHEICSACPLGLHDHRTVKRSLR